MTRMIALDDVKALLPIRSGNASYDTRITGIIATVSRLIERECRQTFPRSERTESHTSRDSVNRALNLYGDGNSHSYGAAEQIVPLRATPIDSTAPVTVWYDPAHRFDDDTVIPDEYWTLDTESDRIILRYPTRRALSALRVRYTAGYAIGEDGTLSASLAEQAPELKEACLLGCVHLWNRSSPEVTGTNKSDEKETGHPNSYGLPKEALNLLSGYRRVLTGRG